ncbi:MAG: hypothetical protein JNJ41_08555 [Bacteroidia bacterium]|nr:hypothetical protein [Bacteroidia bacterium]
MKKIKFKPLFFCFIFIIALFMSSEIKAQLSPEGKTYTLLTNSVCKKMEGGGCNIDYYKVMEFTKNKVSIYELVKASCTPKEREENYNNKAEPIKSVRYWTIKDNQIFIEKYDEYGKLELKGDKLIGKRSNGSVTAEFLEKK